ncbi:MAG: hypothetical protein J6X88_04445 [Bacteroidales bacterium]|nr:hypothetical protein [Bacteroidales bacterium]
MKTSNTILCSLLGTVLVVASLLMVRLWPQTLRDAAGREVLRKALPAGTDSVELDLSGLAAGTYFGTLSTPAAVPLVPSLHLYYSYTEVILWLYYSYTNSLRITII